MSPEIVARKGISTKYQVTQRAMESLNVNSNIYICERNADCNIYLRIEC